MCFVSSLIFLSHHIIIEHESRHVIAEPELTPTLVYGPMAETPYQKDYVHTKDIDRFFEYDDLTKTMTFTSESLVVYIPYRYSVYNLLTLADTVTTLGIVDLVIDDTYHAGLLMLATIEMEPDSVDMVMIGDLQYVKLTLSNGCKFICNTDRISDSSIVCSLWMEFITRGKPIYNIGYDTLSTLFDQAKSMCDQNIPVDHVVFEVIYSHLCRDPDNLSIQYRHTDMTKDFKMIALRDVGYATVSTTSRLLGSYFFQGLNASLLQTTTERSDIEDLLRS